MNQNLNLKLSHYNIRNNITDNQSNESRILNTKTRDPARILNQHVNKFINKLSTIWVANFESSVACIKSLDVDSNIP